MPSPSAEKIADIVLNRRPVYDLTLDSLIRELSNRLTARALFEFLAGFDEDLPTFREQVSAFVHHLGPCGPVIGLLSFQSGFVPEDDEEDEAPKPVNKPTEYYLKIIFENEDASYYQFHFFPDLDAPYVLGASRKREGAAQYVRITVAQPEAVDEFIESLHSNPFFVGVERSSAEEFARARSHGV